MKIGEYTIGIKYPPFIIAEMSGNHNQSLDTALKIIDAASKIGVHAIKIQTYTPDTITINKNDNEFYINDEKNIWKGQSLYNLYSNAHTPWEWHEVIFSHAKKKGIMCFSTPFDESAVDFLEKIKVPAYKVSSFENIHLPLIEKVALTGKPMIISTGLASIAEIYDLVQTIKNTGNKNFILLKCTSAYPASSCDSNVITIPNMRDLFKCEVGLSDHTLGIGSAIAAVAHGASVIEKHFTLSRKNKSVDSSFSLEPKEMEQLVHESKNAWLSIGKIQYGACKSEKKLIKHRRSLYIVMDIKKGEKITRENLRAIRPGLGIKPKYFEIILGQTIKKDVKKGTPFSWEFLK